MCAPDCGPKARISATRPPPVAFASNAGPVLSGKRRCAMMPEPTTAISRNAVATSGIRAAWTAGRISAAGRATGASALICTLLLKPVEPHRAAGLDAVLGFGRGACETIEHHLRRTREKPVRVRVVGRPQDPARADIIGQHLNAALDRLERDPAIAPEQLAGAGFEAGIVEPLVVEMTVHAIEPRRDPAAARLQESERIFGWRSQTPPQITAIAASIISIVCEMIWRAPWVSKRSTPTVGMPPPPEPPS